MSEERLIKVRLVSSRPSSSNHIFQSANYVRTELPVRLAHRIRDLQALPYAIVMQEGVSKVYEVRRMVSRLINVILLYFLAVLVRL
jgi:Mitochondrial branched-chain alpha-ketoacid dehydrogenase kinase